MQIFGHVEYMCMRTRVHELRDINSIAILKSHLVASSNIENINTLPPISLLCFLYRQILILVFMDIHMSMSTALFE